jgi:hypothetical protein
MMKGDSSPSGLLTARGTSGALAPAFASVSQRLFPETLLPLHLRKHQRPSSMLRLTAVYCLVPMESFQIWFVTF